MSMYPRAAFAVLIGCLALSPAGAAPAPAPTTDPSGDPLPPGVVARLGTVRLRHMAYALRWAPDGRTLVSAGVDGAMRFWDAAGKEIRQGRGLPNVGLQAITYFPDGKSIATKANENTIRVWDAATGREVRTLFPAQYQVAALAPGPEEGTLLELAGDGTLHIWDLTTGKDSRQIELSKGKPQTRLALSPDGKRVAGFLLAGDVLTVWDASSGKELFHAPTKLTNLMSLVFSPDGKTLAASGAPGHIVTWDVEAGKELRRYEDAGFLQWLTFAPDGKSVAGLGAGRTIHLWDLTSAKELRQFEAPASCGAAWWGFVGGLAFSPDGKTVAASQGAAIHLWDVETGKELNPFSGHTAAVEGVRFSPDGKRILSCGGGGDATARLWDLASAKEIASWANVHGSPYSMVALPDGQSVLATSPSGWLRVELGGEKAKEVPLSDPPQPVEWFSGLALSLDGKTVLGAGQDRSIHLWYAKTGQERERLPIPVKPFGASAVSPDGKLLAEGGGGATVRLWDLAAGKEARLVGDAPAAGQFRDTRGMTFSPDGRNLLHLGAAELTVYEVATGRERIQATRPTGPFSHDPFSPEGALARAVYSPDGETLAVGTTGGPVLLLDAQNGRELARLTGHANVVTSLAFSADGDKLAAGCVDGTVLVWLARQGTPRDRPAAADLKPEKLAALWESLGGEDAAKAYKAVLTLAASPKASAPYLKERLSAATEEVRGLRAVEALERSGAAEAEEAIRGLAKDGPTEAIKEEARAALNRLARRKDSP